MIHIFLAIGITALAVWITIKFLDYSSKKNLANQWISELLEMNDSEMMYALLTNGMVRASTEFLYSFSPIQYASPYNTAALIFRYLKYLHKKDFQSPQLTDDYYQELLRTPIIDMSDDKYKVFHEERQRRAKQERYDTHVDIGCEYLAITICRVDRWSYSYLGAILKSLEQAPGIDLLKFHLNNKHERMNRIHKNPLLMRGLGARMNH